MLNVKGIKKIYHANTDEKETGVTILYQTEQTSEQGVLTGTERNIILIKRSIY